MKEILSNIISTLIILLAIDIITIKAIAEDIWKSSIIVDNIVLYSFIIFLVLLVGSGIVYVWL